MRCQRCERELERPGDYCLTCRSRSADVVVLDIGEERAELTMLDGQTVLGHTAITTTTETAERLREIQRRNYVERVAGELRRKRPEAVYATGERALLRRLRRAVGVPLYRIQGEDPVAAYLDHHGQPPLEVVDGSPASKLGGSHTTLIGGRGGRAAVTLVASHPHVKKIVPGPIDAGGSGSSSGVRAKITRTDDRGNIRMLIRDGSSVQTVRVITTAGDRGTGRRIAAGLADALADDADRA